MGLSHPFFKQLAHSLASPLSILFTISFKLLSLLDIWRVALISPIFKKGLSSDVRNYRPISLICIVCKVMESVVNDQLMSYLLKNKLITKHQHGFLKQHSTCSQLIEYVNDWSLALNSRRNVDVIYIKFSKAFDCVVNSKLIR